MRALWIAYTRASRLSLAPRYALRVPWAPSTGAQSHLMYLRTHKKSSFYRASIRWVLAGDGMGSYCIRCSHINIFRVRQRNVRGRTPALAMGLPRPQVPIIISSCSPAQRHRWGFRHLADCVRSRHLHTHCSVPAEMAPGTPGERLLQRKGESAAQMCLFPIF